MATKERVIVVGAGISGLAAAFRLQQSGFDVSVLEAANHAGGRMVTVTTDGYRFDTGAIVLSRRYRQMLRLASELGLTSNLVSAPGMIAIPRGGRRHHVHVDSPLRTLFTRIVSWRAKVSAIGLLRDVARSRPLMDWYDLSMATSLDVESVYDYVGRHSTAALRDSLIDPLYRGLYLTDMADMSVVDFLFIFNNYYGDNLFTFRDGVGALTAALASRLTVRLGTRVLQVEEHPEEVRVYTCAADGRRLVESASACVIGLAAPQMARIYPQLAPEYRQPAQSARYSRILNVQLALTQPAPEKAFAVMLSRQECPELCSIFLDHNKNPLQVPEGRGLATVFWDTRIGETMWELPDDQIVARTIAAASRVLPGLESTVRFGLVTRHDPGIATPEPGAYKALAPLVRSRAAAQRVHLAGDYFAGGSTNSCLCSGERAAEFVRRRLHPL